MYGQRYETLDAPSKTPQQWALLSALLGVTAVLGWCAYAHSGVHAHTASLAAITNIAPSRTTVGAPTAPLNVRPGSVRGVVTAAQAGSVAAASDLDTTEYVAVEDVQALLEARAHDNVFWAAVGGLFVAIPAAIGVFFHRHSQTVDRVKAGAFGAVAATVLSATPAMAADVKLGGDDGALQFIPSEVTISAGESVTWINNAGYPHNIVFDEDAVPEGVNAEAISHEDYINAPGEKVSTKFTTAGTYSYYCEPHQGAGMQGKVVVK